MLALVIVISLLSVGLLVLLLQHPKVVTEMLSIFMAGLTAYFILIAKNLARDERRRLLACLVLILFSVIFWMLYQQAPMSLMLFMDRCVDLHLAGIVIPTSSAWAISGIALLVLAPIIMQIWQRLSERKIDLSYAVKFGLGIGFMGLSYLLLATLINLTAMNSKLSLGWMILSFSLQSLGELCLSPIGLAMISILAPKNMRGLLVGIWFLALALGSDLAGWLAKWSVVPAHATWGETLAIYHNAFADYGTIGVGVGLILFIINPWLKQLVKQTNIKARIIILEENSKLDVL